jgi:predicted metal-dependent peptidase
MSEAAQPFTHRGTRAIQHMVEYAPATGGLALWIAHRDGGPDGALITTDGRSIRYGEAFERLPLPEQAGLVAHEVLHIALRHPQRYLELRSLLGDVDLELFTIAADAIVNSALSHLSWLVLPPRAVQLEALLEAALDLRQPVEKSLLEWDVERLYRALDDRRSPDTGARRSAEQGTGDGSERMRATDTETATRPRPREDGPRSARARALATDLVADLRPDPDQTTAPEDEAEAAREWTERLLRGHASDGEFSMLRTLPADLPRTRTPWQQLLRTALARSLAMKPDVSWSRPARSYIANQGRCGPARRLPWEPGITTAKRVPKLVVIVDISGSIDDDLLERFAREIDAITRRQDAGLVVIAGDDRVRQVVQVEPGRSSLGAMSCAGGGGTDFTPLLEEAGAHRPDACVVLTDLDGPARVRPRWPVIWAVTEAHADAVVPFGRKLVLS